MFMGWWEFRLPPYAWHQSMHCNPPGDGVEDMPVATDLEGHLDSLSPAIDHPCTHDDSFCAFHVSPSFSLGLLDVFGQLLPKLLFAIFFWFLS